jgi:hypothetical protein
MPCVSSICMCRARCKFPCKYIFPTQLCLLAAVAILRCSTHFMCLLFWMSKGWQRSCTCCDNLDACCKSTPCCDNLYACRRSTPCCDNLDACCRFTPCCSKLDACCRCTPYCNNLYACCRSTPCHTQMVPSRALSTAPASSQNQSQLCTERP